MPGIVGIISKGPRAKHEDDLGLMMNCMMHEPFYENRRYVNEQLGIYAGWVGHKGSFSDCMPSANENGDVVLMFSGEHFADGSVPDQLKRRGHAFKESNAAYLVHLYEEHDEAFLGQLNGWFCGLLIDCRKSSATLFNDRYGMHRVYYHESQDAFLFSSEAKSLLRVRPDLRAIELRGLGELVNCGCVLQNRTLFPRVSSLPGGAAWKWSGGNGVKKHYYFRPSDWEQRTPLGEEAFYTRLRDTFLQVVPRYVRTDERIGLSLSGGLDTRMVIAGLNPRPGQFPCYTFGSTRDMLDIRVARKVADACHLTHHTLRLDQGFLADFADLATKTIHITDGCLDVCNTHDIYLNRLARPIAPVRLSGKFGSEIIRNHTMFRGGGTYLKLFDPEFATHVATSVHTLDEMKKGNTLSVAVFKEFPWHQYGKLAMEQSQIDLRTPYMDNDLIEVMYQAPEGVRSSNLVQRRIIRECSATLSRIMTDRGFVGESTSLVAKARELFFYSLFKVDYIYLYALPHWLTRLDTMIGALNGDKQLLGYQKFELYRLWFRKQLAAYVREMLLDERTLGRALFNRSVMERIVDGHSKGKENYMNEINQALTVELIHRQFIDV
jgi:asparagine synthase (glutamine-hydrolysing)